MGQAKLRGSREARVASAQAKVEALRPEYALCGQCKAQVTALEAEDCRNLDGVQAIFCGTCPSCGHAVSVVLGTREAVEDAARAMKMTISEDLGLPEDLAEFVEIPGNVYTGKDPY